MREDGPGTPSEARSDLGASTSGRDRLRLPSRHRDSSDPQGSSVMDGLRRSFSNEGSIFGLSLSNHEDVPRSPGIRMGLGALKSEVRISGMSPLGESLSRLPPPVSIDEVDDGDEADGPAGEDEEEGGGDALPPGGEGFQRLPSWIRSPFPRRASEAHCAPELEDANGLHKPYIMRPSSGSCAGLASALAGTGPPAVDHSAAGGDSGPDGVIPFPFRAHPLLGMAMPGPLSPGPDKDKGPTPQERHNWSDPAPDLASPEGGALMRRRVEYPVGSTYEGEVDPATGQPHGRGRWRSFDQAAEYTGQWRGGQKDGVGGMTYPAGRYEGHWAFDQPEGSGTLQYNGLTYSGAFRAGRASGDGTLSYPNGDECDGEWVGDQRGQRGRMTYANGDVYEWLWGEALGTGSATLTFTNGDRLEGAVVDYMWNGPGKFVSPTGFSYAGEYHDGMMWGRGRLTFRNGSTFEGELRANEFDGFGVYVDALNGTRYEGQWKAGKMHGDGTLTYPSGDKWTGKWVNDKKTLGTYVFKGEH